MSSLSMKRIRVPTILKTLVQQISLSEYFSIGQILICCEQNCGFELYGGSVLAYVSQLILRTDMEKERLY